MRTIPLCRTGLATLAVAGLATVTLAQSTNPRPAPQWLLNALDLTQATVQDLQIPTERRTFRFQVDLGGRTVTVELEPNDIRTPQFELLVDDGTGIRKLPTPPSVTFVGHAPGFAESRAAATVVDGKLDAVVSLDAHDPVIWGIESVAELDLLRPATEHVVYSTDHAIVPGSCGTDLANWQAIGTPGGDLPTKVAEIAIDCDLEYYQRNNSNVTTTQNTVTQIVNGMSAIYHRDVQVQYTISTILVRTARTYVNTNMSSLLSEFRSRWNAQHGNIQRDLAHLFTGKGSFSGTIGIAYVGVVCNLGSAYGVDKAFSSLGTNVGLISHEAGHNWNAPHCDGASPCNIMCSGLGGCSRNLSAFAPVSINTISSFRNSRSCLRDAIQPPTLANIAPNTSVVMPRATITLTGTNLDSVTAVNVGNQQVPASILSDTQIRFVPPAPSSFGSVPVSVVNPSGTSNALSMSFSQSPGFYAAPSNSVRNLALPITFAGDPNDNWWLFVAFNDNRTFPFLGYDILTGNVVLAQGALDGVGLGGVAYPVPDISMAGIVMSSQVILIEETSPALNWVSPVVQTVFFY